MFWKRKKRLFKAIDDHSSVVHDFRLRSSAIGFESYRPVEYKLYHKLEEDKMIPKIDAYLRRLFRGKVDDFNGDVLDNILFAAFREAIPFLGRQHYVHQDVIRRLTTRRQADYGDLEKIKRDREEELRAIKTEYIQFCEKFQGEDEF